MPLKVVQCSHDLLMQPACIPSYMEGYWLKEDPSSEPADSMLYRWLLVQHLQDTGELGATKLGMIPVLACHPVAT